MKQKIVRTPTKATGGITDAERAQMGELAKLLGPVRRYWIWVLLSLLWPLACLAQVAQERESWTANSVQLALDTLTIDHYEREQWASLTHSFELLWTGTPPTSSTVTVEACMRGGTCRSVTVTGASANSGSWPGFADYFAITVTWSGGAVTGLQLNVTGSVYDQSIGGGAAVPAAGLVKSNGTALVDALAADVVTLFGSGTCAGDLRGNGTCAVPHMTFWGDSSISWSANNTNTGGSYTPSAAITITGLDVHIGTTMAGCTTQPQATVYDQTAAAQLLALSMPNATSNVHGTFSVNVPAGHTLTFGQVAGVGCTAGQYLNLTAEYTMQ